MKVHHSILDKPFWKVNGEYVTLDYLVKNPNILIDFNGTSPQEVKEIVLYRHNSIPEGQRSGVWTPTTGLVPYERVIQEIEQETDLGEALIRMELLHLQDLYQKRYEIIRV